MNLRTAVTLLLPTPKASDGPHGGPNQRDAAGNYYLPGQVVRLDDQWKTEQGKDYSPAVRRWERVTGRAAPCPTEPGTRGNRRLSPAFEEWMMGLPAGWVTAVPGIPRNEQMKILGNGVVWQQAAHAFSLLMETDMDDTTEEKQAPEKFPCSGCAFSYTVSVKGLIRKHNSRTGPGLCDGAQKPPKRTAGDIANDFERANGGRPPCGAAVGSGVCDKDAGHGGLCAGPEQYTYGSPVTPEEAGLPTSQEEYDKREATPAERLAAAVYGGIVDVAEATAIGHQALNIHAAGPITHTQPDPFTAPAPVSDIPDGSEDEREHCAQGACTGCCGCSSMCTTDPCGQPVTLEYADGSPVTPEEAGLPTSQEEYDKREAEMAAVVADPQAAIGHVFPLAVTFCPAPDPFTAPAPVSDIPDGSVSQQPEPDRDRWGRYQILGTAHTRATTFAKSCSDTFSLSQWGDRMVVRGLTLRPDLLALAHGLDVKQHRKTLNGIAEQAKEAAGQKVAANLGSAYHAFSERLDAGVMSLADVPEAYRGRLAEYLAVMSGAGLTTRPEWIERTTAVRADQVGEPVAGTLDRIVQLPNGELVIADLKTGSDLSYGWGEIAVQLALYAHGVNTHGLFDWHFKQWDQGTPTKPMGSELLKVRTDYAIVMHLPADKEGCTLYRVDIEAGWEYARLCGHVRAFRKNKQLARPLELTDIAAPVAVAEAPRYRLEMERAISFLGDAASGSELVVVMGHAREARIFTDPELEELQTIASRRWEELATA